MMLLAAGWTWPAVVVTVALVVGATLVLAAMFNHASATDASVLPAGRLDEIEDDLLAIRSDLAQIKESLAELDRMFKSVG